MELGTTLPQQTEENQCSPFLTEPFDYANFSYHQLLHGTCSSYQHVQLVPRTRVMANANFSFLVLERTLSTTPINNTIISIVRLS